MKLIVALLAVALALSGCQTVASIDAGIQKTAPQVCSAISVGYTAFVAADLGSAKDKAAVDAAYSATSPICADPTKATSIHLVILATQLATIIKTMRKVKASGQASS